MLLFLILTINGVLKFAPPITQGHRENIQNNSNDQECNFVYGDAKWETDWYSDFNDL